MRQPGPGESASSASRWCRDPVSRPAAVPARAPTTGRGSRYSSLPASEMTVACWLWMRDSLCTQRGRRTALPRVGLCLQVIHAPAAGLVGFGPLSQCRQASRHLSRFCDKLRVRASLSPPASTPHPCRRVWLRPSSLDSPEAGS